MNTSGWISGLILMVAFFAGCDESASNAPSATRVPSPPTGAAAPSGTQVNLPPGVIRAEDATGVWNKAQVEEYLRGDLKLTQLSLSSAGGDNYTGTGATADGRTLQLNVKQVPGGIACTFEDGQGGSGRISFGNKVPD